MYSNPEEKKVMAVLKKIIFIPNIADVLRHPEKVMAVS